MRNQKHYCEDCGKLFETNNPDCNFCFTCAEKEIIRLRDQAKIVEEKLNECPEICDLLEKLSTEEIVERLRAKFYYSEYNPSGRGNRE